jgi:hypothetical protein
MSADNSMLVACRYALTTDYLQHCIKKNMYKVGCLTLAEQPAVQRLSPLPF